MAGGNSKSTKLPHSMFLQYYYGLFKPTGRIIAEPGRLELNRPQSKIYEADCLGLGLRTNHIVV